ncbi:LysR substrate-binding domain-containing protein [Rhodoferax sediminis]|uniref:LysR family transcriptional regulator n=1 Tax=Rhodoferax sediminis TaxID=2509614 RepID=A0A515DE21_9BURK|nr:LysR substrate-binding domain-containing protein [Rhodoferax sediminis]QDL38620.1 LysR family transcriptional regulator [Rhodoferax sediminis]
MELRHLRYFVAAAEEEHFGRASHRLHVSRPAVSQMVADLEEELGIMLFERMAQRVKLTAAGRALLPQFQTIIGDLHQAVALAKRVGEGKTGVLNIGYGSLTLLHPLFRAAMKRFHETYPEVTLSLFEIPTSEQPKALAEGKIHAGFMHFGPKSGAGRPRRAPGAVPQDETVLENLRIQSGGLGVVVPHDHALAPRKSVSLAELSKERFVVVPRSSVSPGYGPLYALCQKAGFQPQIVQEVGSIASQLNLVSVGMGIGLTVTGKNFNYPASLAVIPLKDVNYTTTFALGWVKGRTEPVLDRLVAIVKELAT